jgi:hypothetical protein
MTTFSYKYKIIVAGVAFVLFAIGMFVYGYNILDGRNQVLADTATQRQAELEMLRREQRSFEQGKRDLANLAAREVPPEELFSKDTKVVKEIRSLEETAARFGLSFKLAIAGSTKTALVFKGASSELFIIPYTATVEGSYDELHSYLQEAEHLPFVTHTTKLSVTALESGDIRAILSSQFYIKK